MLDFFGYTDLGKLLIESIETLLVEKKSLTPDLGGNSSTSEVGDEIVKIIRNKYES